ncbi:hypothetical protein PFISCL1PPCAC_3122, partial [Pristionchus fissidentatus]
VSKSVRDTMATVLPVWLALLSISAVTGEQLLLVQSVCRHGQRIPTTTYPNDPYDEAFWGTPLGELTKKGMSQQFAQGKRMRKMYVEDNQFMSGKYSRYETYVFSSDMPRCSQSAQAYIAAFFTGSPTFPSGVNDWPSSWTPIPVHTVPLEDDYLTGSPLACARLNRIANEQMKTRGFQDFLASNWKLFYIINANTGEEESYTFNTIADFYEILSVQRDNFNLTLPEWVTDDFYAKLVNAFEAGNDFTQGKAGFGLPLNSEIVKLSIGFLLNEWIGNINNVIDNSSTLKYTSYYAHDITVGSILIGLGVKDELMGPASPDFASTIVAELWEKEGSHFIKLLFSFNADTEFVPFTGMIAGCGSDLCPLSAFLQITEQFVATDPKVCDT